METLLTSEQALEFARIAARQFAESRLRSALQSAQPSSPTLVQRIDQRDAFYFIVPFQIGSRTTARFMIDAFGGKLKQASGITGGDTSLQRYVTPQDALDRMFRMRTTGTIKKWDFEFRRELVGVHPVLVWKPCPQSPTPFLPFYQFTVGSSLEYLRVDGEAFTALAALPPNRAPRATARAKSKSRKAARPRR